MQILRRANRAIATLVALGFLSACGAPQPTGPASSVAATFAAVSPTPESDVAAAHALVARYEAASVAGDDATAWSLLAAQSQAMFPSRPSYADSRRVASAGTASAYVVGEPRTDDPRIPGWLAKSDPGVLDPARVFAVDVAHPDASPVAARLEVFFVALDMSGAWKIWILN